MDKRRIALLGSTGSIGVQTLQVVSAHSDLFEMEILTARRNADLLIRQAVEFRPNAVVIADESLYARVREALDPYDIKVYAGYASVCDVAGWSTVDMVVNALVGFSGLEPSLRALEAGKALALANKESLVAGGALVMAAAKKHRTPILPVDSEHSAIFQCLQGEGGEGIEALLLTASGGPFFSASAKEMEALGPESALRHPTWSMGPKVTVDSATMMNKGLEIIEAYWLFGVPTERIKVVVHPQSMVHSMVAFRDGSVKAQLGYPDMRIPIQYALAYPHRLPLETQRLDFAAMGSLRFLPTDDVRFPAIPMAYKAIQCGGNKACCMNAANEVAVEAFLHHRLGYREIVPFVSQVMESMPLVPNPTLAQIKESHFASIEMAQNLLK